MKNEIMASFLLAGAVLLLGAGGYLTLSGAEANATAQENMTANVSIPEPVVVANVTNVSAIENVSSNATSANQSADNATSIINATANMTNSTVSNHTNVTIVYNDSGTYGGSSNSGSSGGGSGSSGSGSHTSTPANNPANTINGSGGLLHYNDCLAISNGKVCLEDIAVDSPNEAILTVYDAKGKQVSNVQVAPGGDEVASLGNGKSIYISVYSTAINGSDIQALVYIRGSGIYSGQSVLVSQGMLAIGDCVKLAYSNVCLEDVAMDWPHQAIFSVYDTNGRLISNVMAPVAEQVSVIIGDGKSVSITVSQTIIANGSAWANTTVKYASSDFGGKLLFYGECVNTSHASVCLADIAAKSPYEAMLEVYDGLTGKLSSNVMVAPGASEQVKLDDTRAVTVYVYGTMASGSSVWALVSATDTKISNNAVSGTIGFDECVSSDFAKVCLYDFDSNSPNNPIFEVYNAGGDFVSNVMVAPGASKTVRVGNSSSAEISVLSKDLNAYTATVSIAKG